MLHMGSSLREGGKELSYLSVGLEREEGRANKQATVGKCSHNNPNVRYNYTMHGWSSLYTLCEGSKESAKLYTGNYNDSCHDCFERTTGVRKREEGGICISETGWISSRKESELHT